MANSQRICHECGCLCESCVSHNSLNLHKEIENLKVRLADRELQLVQMENSVLISADRFPNGEMQAMQDEVVEWQDKYERLAECYKKLQRVNQGLEDKLLKIVDKYETEKASLNKDVASMTSRLVEARVTITELEEENEQYRNDCNIAVQLLQCKPSNFVAHKLDTLPADLQNKVKGHMRKDKLSNGLHQGCQVPDMKTIRVPIPTFPPTAMVYSLNKEESMSKEEVISNQRNSDLVSAAIMAKVLEERAKERKLARDGLCKCKHLQLNGIISLDSTKQTKPSEAKETQTDFPSNNCCYDADCCLQPSPTSAKTCGGMCDVRKPTTEKPNCCGSKNRVRYCQYSSSSMVLVHQGMRGRSESSSSQDSSCGRLSQRSLNPANGIDVNVLTNPAISGRKWPRTASNSSIETQI